MNIQCHLEPTCAVTLDTTLNSSEPGVQLFESPERSQWRYAEGQMMVAKNVVGGWCIKGMRWDSVQK